MTAEATMTAALAAINSQFSTTRAYSLSDVPAARPAEYVTVLLIRRPGARLNSGGTTGIVGYRLRVRAVSQFSDSNVRDSLEKCRAGLEFKRLTVGSQRSTPIQFETEDDVSGSNGSFAAYVDYTFTL